MEEILLLTAAGLVAGFIAGLTGVGTGIVMLAVIPMVVDHYHVPDASLVSVTIANAVFATMVSSSINILTTIRRQHFYATETFYVAGSAVVMSVIIFEVVVRSAFYSQRLFNTVLVIFLVWVVIQSGRKLVQSDIFHEKIVNWKMLVTGSLAGAIAALTGIGGGTVTIPLLNIWMKVDIVKAKSISFGTLLAISFWLSVHNVFFVSGDEVKGGVGLIIFPMITPALVGILIASPLGVLVSERIPARLVSISFLIIVAFVAAQKLVAIIHL